MQQPEPHHDDPRRLGDERKRGSPKRIVFVLTNTFVLGNTGRATGWDIEEFAVPYFLLAKQHYLFFASVNGGVTQFDPVSFERSKDNEYVKRIVYDDEARHHWEHTKRLSTLNPDHFDAIVFPGGHGAMFDLPDSQDCQHLVTRLYENGGIIASVCHGAAGFVHAKLSDGSNFVEGKRLTCFSNQEEKACGLAQAVPFLLQSELEKAGALFECSRLGQGKTVTAERLITGQNPGSLNEWVSSLQLALHQQPQRHERLEQYHHQQEQHEHVHHGPFKPQLQQQASGGHYHQRVASLNLPRSEEEERPREIVITAQAAADSTSKLWDTAETQQGVAALDIDQRGMTKDQRRRVEEGDVQQRDKSQQAPLEKKNAREPLPAADEDVSRRGEQVGIKQDQIKEASVHISPLDGDIEAAIPLLFQGGVNEQRLNEQQEADVQHSILKKIDAEGGIKKEHKGRKSFGSPEEQGEIIPPQ